MNIVTLNIPEAYGRTPWRKAWTTLDKTKEDKEFNTMYSVKSESVRYLSIVYLSLECATNWNGKSIFRS